MKTWLITVPMTKPVKETLLYKVQAKNISEAARANLIPLLPIEVIPGWPYGSKKDVWCFDGI